jgi:hypothetical protein
MFSVAPLLVVLISVVVFVRLGLWGGSQRRALTIGGVLAPEDAAVARAAIRRFNGCLVAALLVATAVFVVLFLDPFAIQRPQWLGVGLAVSPGIAAVVGLLTLAAIGPVRWPAARSGPRSAELATRTLGRFGPRWGFALPLATAALLVAFLVATGIASSADENGLYRQLTLDRVDGSGSAGPYPGWFYGVPVIAVTVVLALATLVALFRIANSPSAGSEHLAAIDERLRRAATRSVMLLGTSSLLFYFGAVVFFAGQAGRSVSDQVRATGSGYVHNFAQPQFAIGVVEMVLGALLAVEVGGSSRAGSGSAAGSPPRLSSTPPLSSPAPPSLPSPASNAVPTA